MKSAYGWLTGSALLLSAPFGALAADLSLPNAPLFVPGQNIAPLVMLVMGRDHTLYYEAYNDASDLDGDGKLDTYFRPVDNEDGKAIRYYGYFDSDKCYKDLDKKGFTPTGFTKSGKCKSEGGGGRWSGNFLNYLTTSRIDALRKVLYGGLRTTRQNQITLERAYIPQDAHSWGKTWDPTMMNTAAKGGLKISDYTNLSDNNGYFFANTTKRENKLSSISINPPLLRVLALTKDMKIGNSNPLYIWNWVSKEQPVADDRLDNVSGTVTPTDYQVFVDVCVGGLLESNCKAYGNSSSTTTYVPTGLLQNYGEGDSPKMYFGLISGSHTRNTQGGVLRAKIGKMNEEILQDTGQFTSRDNTPDGPGIINTLNKLRVANFKGSNYDGCGWITDRAIIDGQCSDWGNPIGEMLYESLRYFAGAKAASTAFSVTNDKLGLRQDTWDDPFALINDKGYPQCAKPVNLVISDLGTSYDSDSLPGTRFGSYSGQLPAKMAGLNVSHWTDLISASEAFSNKKFFIGEVKDQTPVGLPTAKSFGQLSNVRGLAPMEPTKQGGYYAAGLAYYGQQTDINPREGSQKPQTVVVAMASNLPQIKINAGKGVVTLIPFAKSVGGYGIKPNDQEFQPTNTIVDYYVETISPTAGSFRINFEDVEQGADHDMDMIVRYQYQVLTDGRIKITLTSEYAAGGIDQHAGYVISGTTADGLYLDVKDRGGSKVTYYMDTVAATDNPHPDNARNNNSHAERNNDLPLERTRTFSVNPGTVTADFLPSPLFYAAKWGGFVDLNGDGIPQDKEWDADGDGQPDNYFLVTNANNLEKQLQSALDKVSDLSRSATSLAFTSSELTSDSLAFTNTFEAKQWSGDLIAYPISQGLVQATPKWKANQVISNQGASNRKIFTMADDGSKRLFTTPSDLNGDNASLSKAQIDALLAGYPNNANADKLKYAQALVNYLRGDRSYESETSRVPGINKPFRARNGVLGDNVNSSPVSGVSGDGVKFVIFGANDGMVHVLDASTGQEIFAYVPSTSYPNLHRLAATDYSHRYFVDGNIKIVNTKVGNSRKTIAVGTFGLGAKGAWALDLTELKTLANNKASADKVLLWELTDKKNSAVGFMQNTPAITSLGANTSTQWLAIFGNGYNAGNNAGKREAELLVVDLLRGTVAKTLTTGVGASSDPTAAQRPNALAEPVIADTNGDGVGDYLYAGDLFGNLWKVKLDSDLNQWAFTTDHNGTTTGATPLPLFKAVSREGKPQPITVRPSVARHPNGGVLVFVGTGKYLEASDISVTNQPTQSVYAIWDKAGRTTEITRSKLLAQTLGATDTSVTPHRRATSTDAIDWTKHQGWYLDLYSNGSNGGERVNSRILVTNQQAAITSMIPSDDICAGGGSGWYMAVNIYNGSNQKLLEHSIKLDRIPSEPVYNYSTTTNGDYQAGNALQTDGGTIINAPTTLYKTGAGSWQRLY